MESVTRILGIAIIVLNAIFRTFMCFFDILCANKGGYPTLFLGFLADAL